MKKIIITGGSGFLGTEIIKQLLEEGGYSIVVLDIRSPRIDDPRITFVQKNLLNPFGAKKYPELEDAHAVIHLSGKNIFGRFTHHHTKLIYDTRIVGTRNLVHFLSQDPYRPKKIVAASAIGFYGDQPGERLDESSARESYHFLSDVVTDWEEENMRAQNFKIPVTCIRNGHIIGSGGLLQETAKSFKLKFGTILGRGNDHMPWIDIRDLARLYILTCNEETPEIINGVSNTLITQDDFSHAIGKVKRTRWYLPIYKWMLLIAFGDFAHEMLVDQQVVSEVYSDIGFTPNIPDIKESTLYHLNPNH